MFKLVVGILLGMMLVVGGALAENTTNTTNEGSSSGEVAHPQDFDQDGIIDEMDACPDTPTGTIIINPFEHPDYAGCTCEQVRGLINTSSPCVEFYCFQELLEIRYDMLDSTLVDCPEDFCEGYTYHDFTNDGYTSCVDGKLKEYTCYETFIPNATICDYVPPTPPEYNPVDNSTNEENASTNNFTTEDNTTIIIPPTNNTTIEPIPPMDATNQPPVPSPPEEEPITMATNTYYLTDAIINYSLPEELREGDNALFKLQFTTEGAGMNINPNLITADGQELSLINVNCTDVDATHVCTGTWELPTDKERDENLELVITYTTSEGTTTDNIPVPIKVRELPFKALPSKSAVITALEPKEEILVRAIYEEYAEQKAPLIDEVDEFIEKMRETTLHVVTEKKTEYDKVKNTTTITITIQPNPGIVANNITIIEYIPKEIANNVDDLTFSIAPTQILNDDPLVMWHFAAVDERVDLSYEVKGELSVTGNTIVVADELENEKTLWFIIIPLLMIPLLILLLVVVPHTLIKREEE